MNSPQGVESQRDRTPLGCGCSVALLDEAAQLLVVATDQAAGAVRVGEREGQVADEVGVHVVEPILAGAMEPVLVHAATVVSPDDELIVSLVSVTNRPVQGILGELLGARLCVIDVVGQGTILP